MLGPSTGVLHVFGLATRTPNDRRLGHGNRARGRDDRDSRGRGWDPLRAAESERLDCGRRQCRGGEPEQPHPHRSVDALVLGKLSGLTPSERSCSSASSSFAPTRGNPRDWMPGSLWACSWGSTRRSSCRRASLPAPSADILHTDSDRRTPPPEEVLGPVHVCWSCSSLYFGWRRLGPTRSW